MAVETETKRVNCACCGYLTCHQDHVGDYSICPVCFWEDDPMSFSSGDWIDTEVSATGVTLAEARENFRSFGAERQEVVRYTRPPNQDEIPDNGPDPDGYFRYTETLPHHQKAMAK